MAGKEGLAAGLAAYEPQLSLLDSLPGIDRASARALLLEIGPEPEAHFPTVEHLAAWAGLAPGNNESAGKRRSGRTRQGSPHVRALLTDCAHGAARTLDCQFHGYHKALTAKRGYKRATVATAHKLLRAIYAMLRDGQCYVDPQADYEKLLVKRNRARWVRMMVKHGFARQLSDGRHALTVS